MSDETIALESRVEYPTSDGRPVAETPLHYDRLSDAWQVLTMRYRSQPRVYVGVNMLVYDQPGNARRQLSPDLFVAFDVRDRDREREVYKLWEDGAPAFVLEVTSRCTRPEDERKMTRYLNWGVAEYFLYDPRGEYVKPALKGFELVGSAYHVMATDLLPNGKPGFTSRTLGLGLWLDGSVLRFYDPETGRNLLTARDAVAETARIEAEIARTEAKIARTEAEIARFKAKTARTEAEIAWFKTETARNEAEIARTEAKIARLKAETEETAEAKERDAEARHIVPDTHECVSTEPLP